MVKIFISQEMISFRRTALAIANVTQEEVFSVLAFVHQRESLVNKTKIEFSLWRKFQTVIALAQLGSVWNAMTKGKKVHYTGKKVHYTDKVQYSLKR